MSGPPYSPHRDAPHDSASDTDDDVQFPWDEVPVALPKELLALWNRAAPGGNRVEQFARYKPTATLQRYDNAFRVFWAFASNQGFDVPSLSVDQTASLLLLMSQRNQNQARHAYSACCLLPGFESLRFSPLLKAEKRKWNSSQAAYSDFWEADEVF